MGERRSTSNNEYTTQQNNRQPNEANQYTRIIRCYNCNKEGHMGRDCRTAYQNNNNNNTNQQTNTQIPLQTRNTPNTSQQTMTLNVRERTSSLRELTGICLINNQQVNYMLDTGSSVSIINNDVVESFKDPTIKNAIKPCTTDVMTANGESANIIGQLECELQIGTIYTNRTFLVARNFLKQCILGMDFIASCPYTANIARALKITCDRGTRFVCDVKNQDAQNHKYCDRSVELIKQACTAESAEMADVYRSRTPEAVQTPELVEAVEVPIPQCASLISKVKVASEAHIASCSSFIQKLTNELKKITSRGLASLTPTTAISHVITVNENAQPIKQKMRLVPYNLKDELKRTLMDMKNAGIIKDSKSPWSSPVRLVRKKDGSLRVTTNYRKLNNVTVKDSYPIPRIDEMINQLAKAKVYTTLDLASGYYQVPIEPDSAQYTAFACEFGFFTIYRHANGINKRNRNISKTNESSIGWFNWNMLFCISR
jgi:predicted aspartyl protease